MTNEITSKQVEDALVSATRDYDFGDGVSTDPTGRITAYGVSVAWDDQDPGNGGWWCILRQIDHATGYPRDESEDGFDLDTAAGLTRMADHARQQVAELTREEA